MKVIQQVHSIKRSFFFIDLAYIAFNHVATNEERYRAIAYPDSRGVRIIGTNIVGAGPNNKRPSLTQRYDAALQFLNRYDHGEQVTPLTEIQLKAKRLQLKEITRELMQLIKIDTPMIKHWSKMRSDLKMYYLLKLEGKAGVIGIKIYLCKNQWFADNLFVEAFKVMNQTDKRRMQRTQVKRM